VLRPGHATGGGGGHDGKDQTPRSPSDSIFSNSTPVVLDDEIRFYYGGYAGGATGGPNDLKIATGVGMASIPRDRFAGIAPLPKSDQPTLEKPLEHIGQITLKPIRLGDYREIRMNADASSGSIAVEVLDAEGRRLRGFSKGEAVPITAYGMAHSLQWKEASLDDLLDNEEYMLRIHLDNATVYALTLR